MDISIIIVNYNTTGHLKKCIDSIVQFTYNVEYEIIVIDNNSPQRDIERLPIEYPFIKFYFRDRNDGFGAGCNFGAENANGKYLLFLNPDILFINNVLQELYLYMEKDNGVGVVSPIYIEDDSRPGFTYNNFPGLKWELYEAIGIGSPKRMEKLLSRYEIKENLPFEVDWVTGSFILIPSNVFKKIQGFDKDIFLYFEDIDLQYEVRKLGYKIICRPDLKIKHYKRSSVRSYYGENLYYYHLARSNLIYMYKHFGIIRRTFSRLFHVVGIISRIGSLPFRLKFRNKKRQKLEQYKLKLILYLSGKNKIFGSKFVTLDQVTHDKVQNTSYDEFWRT